MDVALVGLAITAAIFFLFRRHYSNKRLNRAIGEAEGESRYYNAHDTPEVVTAGERHAKQEHNSSLSAMSPQAHDPHAEILPALAVYSNDSALHQPETYSSPSKSGQTPGAELEVLTELPASAKSFHPGQEELYSGFEVVVPQPREPFNNNRQVILNELNRLRDRRQRLMELDVLNGEEVRLRSQFAELDGVPRP